jgi:RHH-type transcriptional regulator, proline utilization regulon repressor / proline dehydrogenase / delta 1-pyrroline-5-carboxylate dehydrogenase
MLQGAASELHAGASHEMHTDVGPLIDAEAHAGIQSYLQSTHFKRFEPLVGIEYTQIAIDSVANLLMPQLLEISHISEMRQEIFGPVLHVLRYSGDPQEVIKQINALGYGLTLGIQTRIDSRAQQLARSSHIGNVYINRNMIGAVVGVQPFGGEGLSGTGPKAGGPHYLYRFCGEQTITVNTAAAGGNATLLAG